MTDTTVAVSNISLTSRDQALPPGIICGILSELQEHITRDFIHTVPCPNDSRGRYVHAMKMGSQHLSLTEIETYVVTEGM